MVGGVVVWVYGLGFSREEGRVLGLGSIFGETCWESLFGRCFIGERCSGGVFFLLVGCLFSGRRIVGILFRVVLGVGGFVLYEINIGFRLLGKGFGGFLELYRLGFWGFTFGLE